MKEYVRPNYNLSKEPKPAAIAKIGSTLGSADELIRRFRLFYKPAHLARFHDIVRQVWLEQTFLYDGVRRNGRAGNGNGRDAVFAYFFKGMVGISQKVMTDGFYSTAIPTYFKDFFPHFSDHDPDSEPEYFKFPYRNLTLDHLAFVYQLHDRLDVLKEADEKSMSIHEFYNWVTPRAFAYADTQPACIYRHRDGREETVPCYVMGRWHSFIPYLRDMRKKYGRK